MRSIFKPDDGAGDISPYRIQYSIKHACEMLDCGEDRLKEWCKLYGCPIFVINDGSKKYILHEDLIDLIYAGAILDNIRRDEFLSAVSKRWPENIRSKLDGD